MTMDGILQLAPSLAIEADISEISGNFYLVIDEEENRVAIASGQKTTLS